MEFIDYEAAEKARLQPLWDVAGPLADRYSKARIGERFALLAMM
jgi:hypothetical protein